jgi:hypothetical protein
MSNVGGVNSGTAPGASGTVNTDPLKLSPQQRGDVRVKKGTCPFMGSAINVGALPVRNSVNNPLASIDDVAKLGDSGGGNLGSLVLSVFAQGNHGKMLGVGGQLNAPVPPGMLGLNFPGSQGAHPGHSGILMGDPKSLGSGHDPTQDVKGAAALKRLLDKAKDGHISRAAFAQFIAENLARDPNAKVFGGKVGGQLTGDVAHLVGAEGKALADELSSGVRPPDSDLTPKERDVFQKLTHLTGQDNLVGSCGEFGLLFAFLARSPNTVQTSEGPALSVDDVTKMFRDGQLPEGWDKWPKTAQDWIVNTTALTAEAGKDYLEAKAKQKIGWTK